VIGDDRRSLSVPTIFTKEDLTECGPKVRIKYGVDDGIEETVAVAQPGHYARHEGWEATAQPTERSHCRQCKERKPTDYERT